MRLSSDTRKLAPSLCATACASCIMLATRSRLSGYWQMSTSVACARQLIGLKLRLPHSLSQISERMSVSTGELETRALETSGQAPHALAVAAVQFTEREPVAFDVRDHTRRDQFRCRVDHAAEQRSGGIAAPGRRPGRHCAPRCRRARRRVAGSTRTGCRSASVTMIVSGRAAAAGPGHRLDLVRLHGEDDHVLRAGCGVVIGGVHVARHLPRAVGKTSVMP